MTKNYVRHTMSNLVKKNKNKNQSTLLPGCR